MSHKRQRPRQKHLHLQLVSNLVVPYWQHFPPADWKWQTLRHISNVQVDPHLRDAIRWSLVP